MSWSVEWTPRALKDMRRLDAAVRRRVSDAVERYAETGVGDVVQLTDVEPPEYRMRVGAWRVRFQRRSRRKVLVILRVLPRDKAY